MATKNVRWKCETCGSGVLAPSRPRRDDARRYCLVCTERTGRLVERIAPALERQRELKAVARKARAHKQSEMRAAKNVANAGKMTAAKKAQTFGYGGYVIAKEAKKIWKLLEPYHGGRRLPKIEVQMRYVRLNEDGSYSYRAHRSFAKMNAQEIRMAPNATWETLAHELVHCAVRARYGTHRRSAHDKVFYDALKDVTQRRFRTTISFAKVSRYGYEVDAIIEFQLRADPNYIAFMEQSRARYDALTSGEK